MIILKEMKVVWEKFQNRNLSLDAITEQEVISLKEAILGADAKKLTDEEKEVQKFLKTADLGNHKAVVARLYDLFLYV